MSAKAGGPTCSTRARRRFARAGAHLLDVKPDATHNRTVFTLRRRARAGQGRACSRCSTPRSRRIDLRQHTGEHPRLGAVDVVPFVPIEGATMADCVALARDVAADVSRAPRSCRSSCTRKRPRRPGAAQSRGHPPRRVRGPRAPSCSSPTGRRTSARPRRTPSAGAVGHRRAHAAHRLQHQPRHQPARRRQEDRAPPSGTAPAACASSRRWASSWPTAASSRCR